MVSCPSCFAGLSDDSKYCPLCNYVISSDSTKGTVTCSSCGRSYDLSMGKCPNCSGSTYGVLGDDEVHTNSAGDSQTTESEQTPTLTSSAEEPPCYLAYNEYRGHQLSVKPQSVETVCTYLNSEVIAQLDEMLTAVNEAYTSVVDFANSPITVGVPAGFDKAAAVKGIEEAVNASIAAAQQVYNVADAICQYGDGGWNTSESVLAHLNDFIGIGSNPVGEDDGGVEPGGDDLQGSDSLTDDILDMDPNEAVAGTESGVVGGYTSSEDDILNATDEEIIISSANGSESGGVNSSYVVPGVGSGENLNDGTDENLIDGAEDNSDLSTSISDYPSSFSSITMPYPSEGYITETKSSGVLGAVGLSAAAAAAIGGKVYYDKKNEDDEDEDFDDDEEDDDKSKERFNFVKDTGANKIMSDVKSGLNMVEMKKKLFQIGEDGDN